MLHAAQSKPEKIMGLVGVAADPDFTETLVWPALDDDTKAKVMAEYDAATGAFIRNASSLDTDMRASIAAEDSAGVGGTLQCWSAASACA